LPDEPVPVTRVRMASAAQFASCCFSLLRADLHFTDLVALRRQHPGCGGSNGPSRITYAYKRIWLPNSPDPVFPEYRVGGDDHQFVFECLSRQ